MPDGVRQAGFIESPKNERVKRYRRLLKRSFRYREGLFLAEGLKAVAESLQADIPPECVICDQRGLEALEAYADFLRARDIPCFQASPQVMELLASTVTPQGLVAVCPMLHKPLEELLNRVPPVLLVADRVRDPGNLGTMVRIADAAGVGGVIVCSESVDLYNPKTVRSTAGSIFHLPVCVGPAPDEALRSLKEAGYSLMVADAREGEVVWDIQWPERVALVMGNEAWGIPERECELADGRVRIPLAGRAESLNVAAATAVILFEMMRRKRG
ncbi:RNA methyltransferase [Candidatus Solincola tengchongensis]|uniref:TrmH family RNA methyltransferase n=1 Tax=Candidatus Solincola tengchongensis TaxID=2900693 RepID=UPI002579689C